MNGIARAVWNGPFYVGPLTRPVSIGDVLLKTLETAWRVLVSIIAMIAVGMGGALFWYQLVEPAMFPPLKSQVQVVATFDDGSAMMPPAIGKPFRCTEEFPLKIAFTNKSSKTIGHLDFSVEGHAANRSTNLVQDATWLKSDTLIPSGYTSRSCWTVSIQPGYEANTLNYAVDVSGATEADANARFEPETPTVRLPPKPSPSPTASARASPSASPTVALATIRDTDWQKIGMGCSCAFRSGAPAKEMLIAGGDGLMFFRLNGKDKLCAAPDTQAMFDGPVSMSCGATALQVTPFGKIEPGEDGHSSKARLNVADSTGTLSLSGTWSCGC